MENNQSIYNSSLRERPLPARIFGVRISLVTFFILVAITIPVFSDIFHHSFVNYDDYRIIINRIDTYDGLSLKNIKNIILEDYPREEPLIVRDVSYLINTSLFGPLNPKGYLLGNLLLHILVCYLVYLLALEIFPNRYLLAFLSGVFFSIHPIHVESIAWISSRKDPLYTFFFLTALLCYIQYFKKKSSTILLYSITLFSCALFSKSAAIAFFPVLISYRMTMKRRESLTRRELVFIVGVFVTTLIYISWYTGVLAEYGVLKSDFSTNRDWGLWFLSGFTYITFYIEKLIFPINLAILYEYPAPNLIFTKIHYVALSILVIASGVGCLTGLWLRGKKAIVFFGLVFLCALLPYLDLAQVNIYVANRYAYLASVPFCILIVYVLLRIDEWFCRRNPIFRILSVFCFSCYVFFLGYQTIQAIKPWENTLTLWRNANRLAPNLPDTYEALMVEYLSYYFENMNADAATSAFMASKDTGEKALERFCENNLVRCPEQMHRIIYGLAQMSWLQGDTKTAEEYLKASIRLNPQFFKARYMYAKFLIDQKRFSEAAIHAEYIEANANPNMDRDILKNVKNIIRPMLDKDKNN